MTLQTPREELIAKLDAMHRHICVSCDVDDEERAHREGYNQALREAAALLRAAPPEQHEDFTRGGTLEIGDGQDLPQGELGR